MQVSSSRDQDQVKPSLIPRPPIQVVVEEGGTKYLHCDYYYYYYYYYYWHCQCQCQCCPGSFSVTRQATTWTKGLVDRSRFDDEHDLVRGSTRYFSSSGDDNNHSPHKRARLLYIASKQRSFARIQQWHRYGFPIPHRLRALSTYRSAADLLRRRYNRVTIRHSRLTTTNRFWLSMIMTMSMTIERRTGTSGLSHHRRWGCATRPIVWDVCDHPNHSLSEYPNRFRRCDCETNPTIRENSRATALCLPKPTRLPSEYRNPRIATFWDWRLGDTPRWILSMISSSNFGFEHISC